MKKIHAVAYLRTSSVQNVGSDSDTRQREAITRCASQNGLEIVEEYYDEAISGTDPIEERPGFSALLDRIDGNGVRTVIVEDVSRFARSMQAHVLGLALLRSRGVTLLDGEGRNLTDDQDEMAEAMIQVAMVFSELEKKRLVKKLRAARERKRATGVKVEGRPSYADQHPGARELAKRLRRASPKTGERRSLRKIAKMLAEEGYTTSKGKPLSPTMVRDLVK